MCGIAGYIDLATETRADDLTRIGAAMAARLRHRGPDDEGVWVDAAVGVSLGHTRLSIIDLSPLGHQPMHSADERFTLVFNGEIYNFPELRRALEGRGCRFSGDSDTEVLVEACAAWGVEEALQRANGMFALAAWDAAEQVLWLGRDRLGEKPLYYGRVGRCFAFASELKAMRAVPDLELTIDRGSLASFLRLGHVPAPWSIHEGVSKLRPGHLLRFDPASPYDLESRPYWSAHDVAIGAIGDRLPEADAGDVLHSTLRDAVAARMVADVPLGAFLSGGIDSSTIVALMQEVSSRPVRTFTIGFPVAGYDEAGYAGEIARHLGTDHTEMYVTPDDALEVIPDLPRIYDEPFADSSQIPTFLVSRMTREHVTVALSGDGGDELFLGYDRYRWTERVDRLRRRLPEPLRKMAAGAITRRSPAQWGRTTERWKRLLPGALAGPRGGDRLHRAAELLDAPGLAALYLDLMGQWDPAELLPDVAEHRHLLLRPDDWPDLGDMAERLASVDLVAYLPDDILTKVDRAAMAVSLETRIPFLDPDVVELAWRMPPSVKRSGERGKLPLRSLLARYVPEELIERPKMGFGVPIDEWLRGPLREWGETLLATDRLNDVGLSPEPIRAAWKRHLDGVTPTHYALWNVLMFMAWSAEQS